MKPIHFRYYARYCTDEPLLLLSACFVWNTKTYKGWYAKYNLLIKVHFNTLQIFLVFDGIIDKVVPYQIHVIHFLLHLMTSKREITIEIIDKIYQKSICSYLVFDNILYCWTSFFYNIFDGFQSNMFCFKTISLNLHFFCTAVWIWWN